MKKQASRVIGVTLFYLRFCNLTCVDPGCHDVNSRWLHVSKAGIQSFRTCKLSFFAFRVKGRDSKLSHVQAKFRNARTFLHYYRTNNNHSGATLFYLRFWNLTCVDPGGHDVNSRCLHVSKAGIQSSRTYNLCLLLHW